MKIFFLLTLLTIYSSFITAQDYHPLPTTNASWTVDEWDEFYGNYYNKIYRVDGDTVLNGKEYTKVFQLKGYPTIFDTVKTLHCFMRQDSVIRKIWFIRHYLGENSEKLGYDLSANIGDTIIIPAFDFGNVGDSVFIRYPNGSGTILINNGEYRREYTFSSISSSHAIQYIEGISDFYSTFPNKSFGIDPFHQDMTLCMQIGSKLMWPTGGDSTICGFTNIGISENQPYSFTCNPNPAMDYCRIEFESSSYHGTLCIFDVFGNNIDEIQVAPLTNILIIDLTKYKTGIYFLELRNISSSHYTKLVVTK